MTNKFTKSVLERQAKELREHPDTPAPQLAVSIPPDTQETPEAIPQETAQASPEAAPTPPEMLPQTSRKTKPTAKTTPDLTDFIVRDAGRTAKNKTFYLDAAVIDAIHRCAGAQKITDSKLVNDILHKILAV